MQPSQELLLNQQQEAFLKSALEGSQFAFLTGAAGTGKSTSLKRIVAALNGTKIRYAVLSPTALAAINVNGQTIHSFFRLPIGILNQSNVRIKREVLDLCHKMDLMIIDEISMVRSDLMDAMDYALRLAKRNHKPFGGVKVIAIGDLYQLSPIVAREEESVFRTLYESPYFFSSNVFKELLTSDQVKTLILEKVFRQSDQVFIDILHRVRNGDHTNEDLLILNKRFAEKSSDDCIMLCTTNSIKHQQNKARIESINSKEYLFEAKMSDDFAKLSENNLPSPAKLLLKIGARVIFTKNNSTIGYHNGMIGEIVEISEYDTKKPKIVVEADGRKFVIEREKWEKYEYGYDEENDKITKKTIGKFEQFPLDLGYAVTIHKSQGQTFDKVLINLGYGSFCHGQTYVALSRCRNLEGIFLSKKVSDKDVIVDKSVNNFYTKLSEQELLSDF